MNITLGSLNRVSFLGDISYDEMAKRAAVFKKLVPSDFSGFGKKAKEMVDSPSWYANIVRLRQPHTIGAVHNQSTNKENLEVIIHNTNLWKNWLNNYFALAISHQSTRVAVWKIGDARATLRSYRTQYNAEADEILYQAQAYINALGLEANIAQTPNVTEQIILDAKGDDVGKILVRKGTNFVAAPTYTMTKDGNVQVGTDKTQNNPMLMLIPVVIIAGGAYLALKN